MCRCSERVVPCTTLGFSHGSTRLPPLCGVVVVSRCLEAPPGDGSDLSAAAVTGVPRRRGDGVRAGWQACAPAMSHTVSGCRCGRDHVGPTAPV